MSGFFGKFISALSGPTWGIELPSLMKEDRDMDRGLLKKQGSEAGQALIDGATGADFLASVQKILGVLTLDSEFADPALRGKIYDKISPVMSSPFADDLTRSACLDVMIHLQPSFARLHLFSMFYQEINGAFAVRETLRLSSGEAPLIPISGLLSLMKSGMKYDLARFSRNDGDLLRQKYIRTGMLNKASFMASTGLREGREYIEELLACRDYDLQASLLALLGDMESRAVQSITVIGHYHNRLGSIFNGEDAADLSAKALTSMNRIARSYAGLTASEQRAIVSEVVIEGSCTWLTLNELGEIADLLKSRSST
jgi:hypothetical protein